MASTRPTKAAVQWARHFFSFGVTGTNGKTSTVHLLASIIAAMGEPGLAVSTLGYFIGSRALDLPPSARGFMHACAELRDVGGRWAAIECTSKSLAEGYAQRWRFDLGIFTNLSPDHQATHGSAAHYLAAKAQLFTRLGPGCTAVLNAADPCSALLDRVIPPDVQRRWYGSMLKGSRTRSVDLEASQITVKPSGTTIALAPSGWADRLRGQLRVQMVGPVYAENALAAATAAMAVGIEDDAIRRGLADCPPVSGRFEVLSDDPMVIVDYAHSPDALTRTCQMARELARGELVVVFGAGGESSAPNREPMGYAVGTLADVAIVTNDNPRREDPRVIAQQVASGVIAAGRASVEIELDRGDAIAQAIERARRGDVVVIAGKGHETGQDIDGRVVPFSDHEHVRRWIGARER